VSRSPDARPRQPARVPSAEVLAVVPFDRVPETVPASLGDTVVAVYENDRTVDWKLSAESALRPGVVAEFWSWRRAWTESWTMGPTTNVSALIDVARRIGYTIGRDVLSVLDRTPRPSTKTRSSTRSTSRRRRCSSTICATR